MKKLQAFEEESDPHFLEVLQADAAETLQCRLSVLDSLPAERLSKLVSLLLDYRLLDVAAFLATGEAACGQLDRLPIPSPAKIVSSPTCFLNAIVLSLKLTLQSPIAISTSNFSITGQAWSTEAYSFCENQRMTSLVSALTILLPRIL